MSIRNRVARLEKSCPKPPVLTAAQRERMNYLAEYRGSDPDTLERQRRLFELVRKMRAERLAKGLYVPLPLEAAVRFAEKRLADEQPKTNP